MNEFEWRRQLRELRQPSNPQHDLWPSIDAALDAAPGELPGRRKRSRHHAWLLRASIAATLLVASALGWHILRAPAPAPASIADTTPWKPADPRLTGASIELGAARLELQMAMRQAPDSVALQRLLKRTERQQAQLRHLANQAS